MKNKKKALTIVSILIIIFACLLTISFVYKMIRTKKFNSFKADIQEKTCDYIVDEKITRTICEEYPSYCKVYFKTLIAKNYIDSDLINPSNNKKVSDDTKNYVLVTWEDNKITCTYKEVRNEGTNT